MKRLLTILMIAMMALSGCAKEETPDSGDEDITDADDEAVDQNGTLPEDVEENVTAPFAALSADVIQGEAPLLVNFTIEVDNGTAWALDFGDGANATGNLTTTVQHTYDAGLFNATLTAGTGNATTVHNLSINATAAQEAVSAVPETTYWEFGESLGCAPDGQGQAGHSELGCISLIRGPGEMPIDGFWIELGEAYWGYEFASTVENQRGDSDCFLLDAELAIIGSAHNSAAPCGNTVVPDGTAWVFLYSYAEPSTGQTFEILV